MSITDTTFRVAAHQKGTFLSGLSHRFARYQTYRRTLDELEALSTRELADLGIHPSQIRAIAYQAAYDG